ncbi:MAG TPA: hypothetical protein VGX76_22090 [Pirellulales bacterium]|nr:hypothetical protein [Pirellulales bacterium]
MHWVAAGPQNALGRRQFDVLVAVGEEWQQLVWTATDAREGPDGSFANPFAVVIRRAQQRFFRRPRFGTQVAQLLRSDLTFYFVGVAQFPRQAADGMYVVGQPYAQCRYREQHRAQAELCPTPLGFENGEPTDQERTNRTKEEESHVSNLAAEHIEHFTITAERGDYGF